VIRDIEWCWTFVKVGSGLAVLPGPPEARATETFTSNTSSSCGCVACWAEHWFHLLWHCGMQDAHITCKEPLPLVVETEVWDKQKQNSTVRALCENKARVTIVNKGTTKDKECMHLVRCLAFVKDKFDIELVASHQGQPQ